MGKTCFVKRHSWYAVLGWSLVLVSAIAYQDNIAGIAGYTTPTNAGEWLTQSETFDWGSLGMSVLTAVMGILTRPNHP